jgi:uncharacterized phage protein gp47/JayE
MPWTTPTLATVRGFVRDAVRANLPGADATVPNSILRVLSDVTGAACHLVLQYIDWLSKMLLPDTAETEWLDRHGRIWLVNADGSTGRKLSTLAIGEIAATGTQGVVLPLGSQLISAPTIPGAVPVSYETTAVVVMSAGPTPVPVKALDPGSAGNLLYGAGISFSPIPPGINQDATVVTMYGGTDTETDDELRARILQRIQEPPMGGDQTDYVQWALAVPGVTRAWNAPLEQGMGTTTVRFMMDDLRPGGLPNDQDVATVQAYIDTKRPVAVKDCFVVAPLPYPLNFYIADLSPDTDATRASIQDNLEAMFFDKAAPGQTIYRSWIDAAISDAIGEAHHELIYTTTAMPAPGYLPVIGSIVYYATTPPYPA